MLLLITGSRETNSAMLDYTTRLVQRIKQLGWSLIIGDAQGIDHQAFITAAHNDVPVVVFGITEKPRFVEPVTNYVRVRGDYLNRDRVMVEQVDRVVAVWNRVSRGTQYTFKYAQSLGKQVDIVEFDL